ncbi:MAG: hexose kinase, partial [Clostridia bacterium]|nr:hexose kinase [Clostridia bacterium]
NITAARYVKKMILTVCLSPCIDIDIEVDTLGVGRSQNIISKRTFYTGKAINVAIGGARLGGEMFATGFMYDENGNQFELQLHRENVQYRFVWNKGRVRVNYKFVDHHSMLTEVNDVSPAVEPGNEQELLDLVERFAPSCEAVIICGGLAKDMNPDYYAKLLNVIPKNVIRIVDSEGDRLLESLKCGVDFIKPNIDEMERTLKRRFETTEEQIEGCRQLISMGAKKVLLSLGKSGAIICNGERSWFCKSINVAMNSTVGAGDAMLAAAALALCQGKSDPDILKCGVAAGTAAVTEPDTISFTKDKYEEILNTLYVEEL